MKKPAPLWKRPKLNKSASPRYLVLFPAKTMGSGMKTTGWSNDTFLVWQSLRHIEKEGEGKLINKNLISRQETKGSPLPTLILLPFTMCKYSTLADFIKNVILKIFSCTAVGSLNSDLSLTYFFHSVTRPFATTSSRYRLLWSFLVIIYMTHRSVC